MQIDDALVDPHLEPIPGLGALSARGLTGGDPQGLCGHAHGTLGLEVLVLGALDEVVADLLQGLDVEGGQGDPDAMDRRLLGGGFLVLVAGLKIEEKSHGFICQKINFRNLKLRAKYFAAYGIAVKIES